MEMLGKVMIFAQAVVDGALDVQLILLPYSLDPPEGLMNAIRRWILLREA